MCHVPTPPPKRFHQNNSWESCLSQQWISLCKVYLSLGTLRHASAHSSKKLMAFLMRHQWSNSWHLTDMHTKDIHRRQSEERPWPYILLTSRAHRCPRGKQARNWLQKSREDRKEQGEGQGRQVNSRAWDSRVNKNKEAQDANAERQAGCSLHCFIALALYCLWEALNLTDTDQHSETYRWENQGKPDLGWCGGSTRRTHKQLAQAFGRVEWTHKCLPTRSGTVHVSAETYLPLTCCSRLRMTATAWMKNKEFCLGFFTFKWSWHIRPSSLNASLISRHASVLWHC